MPYFKDTSTNRILYNKNQYNIEYMDGLIDLVDDFCECYLIVSGAVTEEGVLQELYEDNQDILNNNTYIMEIEFYNEDGVVIEEFKPVATDVPAGFQLVSETESPVYTYKSPKKKYTEF
jgi:hypothetical protein